jgi:hypothetical protein
MLALGRLASRKRSVMLMGRLTASATDECGTRARWRHRGCRLWNERAGRESRPAPRRYLLLFMVSVRYCCVFAVLKALLPASLTSVVTVSPGWILTIFMTGVKPSLAKIT